MRGCSGVLSVGWCAGPDGGSDEDDLADQDCHEEGSFDCVAVGEVAMEGILAMACIGISAVASPFEWSQYHSSTGDKIGDVVTVGWGSGLERGLGSVAKEMGIPKWVVHFFRAKMVAAGVAG